MLGRGVKRKWSSVEDIHAAVKEEEQQNGLGDEDAANFVKSEDMSHLQQRQRVFGLCLQKLQRYQAGMDLSLRRSVLLINTLRQLQEDMRSDVAGKQDIFLNAVHTDSDFLRDDMVVTCSGCSDADQQSISLFPRAIQEPSSQDALSSSDQQKALPAHSDVNAVNTMGYLSDFALDDIFDDIDTSMYETADLPSAWAMGSLWPMSVSLWADEDFKMRSGSHSNTGNHQSCLMDINELDHIMEILVKS